MILTIVKSLARSLGKHNRTPRRRPTGLHIESLDPRTLLSAGFVEPFAHRLGILTGRTGGDGKYAFTNLDPRIAPTDYRVQATYVDVRRGSRETQTLSGHHITVKFIVPNP